MEIADSARKHGIPDEDMMHAIRQSIRWVSQDDTRLLVIGPARDARLLEVVILDPYGDPVVIHADELRPMFHQFLR